MGLTEEGRRRLKGNAPAIERLGYSPQQTAARLNSSVSTVYRLLAAKKLRAVKRGASTLIVPGSVDEYEASLPPFESRATTQTADAA